MRRTVPARACSPDRMTRESGAETGSWAAERCGRARQVALGEAFE
ncbi:hypothetical protein [Streptomyces spirodelae]|nr:hypothetical protein [Streptomyces spirodelae]